MFLGDTTLAAVADSVGPDAAVKNENSILPLLCEHGNHRNYSKRNDTGAACSLPVIWMIDNERHQFQNLTIQSGTFIPNILY